MIIIADSGSTKTDWISTTDDLISKTIGLNPYYLSAPTIMDVVNTLPHEWKNAQQVYFYGAGCSTTSSIHNMQTILASFFPLATIKVYSDMLGAARAIHGNSQGIAGILGTGSNACYYDGNEKLETKIHSLGYIIGDEGGGVHIGKTFLKRLYYNQLPDAVNQLFAQEYPDMQLENVLAQLYQSDNAARFIASFATFVGKNIHQDWAINIVQTCIEEYITQWILPYKNQTNKVGFIGSIAWHFREIVEKITLSYNLDTIKICQEPIFELKKYHQVEK